MLGVVAGAGGKGRVCGGTQAGVEGVVDAVLRGEAWSGGARRGCHDPGRAGAGGLGRVVQGLREVGLREEVGEEGGGGAAGEARGGGEGLAEGQVLLVCKGEGPERWWRGFRGSLGGAWQGRR